MNSNEFLELAKKAILKYVKEELYPSTQLTTDEIYIVTMFGNRVMLGTGLMDLIFYEVILDEKENTLKLRVFDLMETESYRIDQIK